MKIFFRLTPTDHNPLQFLFNKINSITGERLIKKIFKQLEPVSLMTIILLLIKLKMMSNIKTLNNN